MARESSSVVSEDPRFLIHNATFTQQFANIYFMRLMQLREAVQEAASEKWKDYNAKKVNRILDVKPNELSWTIGTCYCEMRLKPNILRDITKEHWSPFPEKMLKFYDSSTDAIMLEDESGRIRLIGNIMKFGVVTGVICAVLGQECVSGEFIVEDVCYAGIPPIRTVNPVPESVLERDFQVLIVSGLNLDGSSHEMPFHLLTEFLTGEIGDIEKSKTISRLMIVGNSMDISEQLYDDREQQRKLKKYGYDSSSYNAKPAKLFDEWISTLLPSIPIDIIPGERDPSNYVIPQQPIKMALFPNANRFSKEYLCMRTNPCMLEVNGKTLLVTAGQNIDDAFRYTESENRLSIAENTLKWRHMAPSAPDTLYKDPFIIEKSPHVYIVGNQPRFESKLVENDLGERIRLILVPEFSDQYTAVLLNLKTSEVQPIQFDSTKIASVSQFES